MPAGICKVRTEIRTGPREYFWGQFGIVPRRIQIVMNNETVCEFGCQGTGIYCGEIRTAAGWMCCEVYGDALGETDKLIGCTSPVYIV